MAKAQQALVRPWSSDLVPFIVVVLIVVHVVALVSIKTLKSNQIHQIWVFFLMWFCYCVCVGLLDFQISHWKANWEEEEALAAEEQCNCFNTRIFWICEIFDMFRVCFVLDCMFNSLLRLYDLDCINKFCIMWFEFWTETILVEYFLTVNMHLRGSSVDLLQLFVFLIDSFFLFRALPGRVLSAIWFKMQELALLFLLEVVHLDNIIVFTSSSTTG